MYVISNTDLQRSTMPGLSHETLAGSANGLEKLSIWRQTIEAGAATPPHRHDCEEVVVVSTGNGELHIDGNVHRFGPDSTLVIPANVDHQIVNAGTTPLRLLAALSTSPVRCVLPDGEPIELPWAT